MKTTYYLAVDVGASSGRLILSHMENGRIILEEIHRFSNEMKIVNDEKVWDIDSIFAEILSGMKKCKEQNKTPKSIGIDTWAVDFVLLDENDQRLGNVVGYRDDRTKDMDQEVYKYISQEELYRLTGIQKQNFNTIYQLMALKKKQPQLLSKAKSMLMIPDYIHFLLTGEKVQEYTNATTTQLVSPVTKDWNKELIELLGYPSEIFKPIITPGTRIGSLRKEIVQEVGFDCEVIAAATHDTASAVAAVPSVQDSLYISSGTWSLMGIEIPEADCSAESRLMNFTNEGGVDYRFRYLKNIMGLWMIQSVKKEIANDLSFGEICNLASQATIQSIVDANDARFLAPVSMTEEIALACRQSNQQVPETIGETASVVYRSLAVCYGKTIEEIEKTTGRHYEKINVIGGGSNAEYLNRLTAEYTGRIVEAGPGEATAIGNIVVQMRADHQFESLSQARECIRNSFTPSSYQP